MSSENRTDDDAPVGDGGRIAKWRKALLSAELRVIDAISGALLRWRSRLEVASGDGGGKPGQQPGDGVISPVVVPPKPKRLVRFLVLMLVLIAGTLAGAALSYRLLSKAITSNSVIIENLRDEVAQMKKQESRDLRQIDRNQQTIRDYDKDIIGYLKEIENSKAEVEDLRSQLSAIKNVRRDSASQAGRGSPGKAATAKPALPLKTGTCTIDAGKDAASLAHCIEEFNRK
jgi:hypothetical protein